MLIPPTLIFLAIVVFYLLSSIKILNEYERAVVFRLGKLLEAPKGPGVILVFAPIDRMVRISLRIEAFEVPAQDVVTHDNVTLKVNAVIYFRVVDPQDAVTLATMLIVAAPPLATVPRWHVTVPLHEPWLGVAETSVSPAGSGSSTVTLWASNGPAFDTASV